MSQYPVLAVGQRFTADVVASMLPIQARKTSASTRTSTTSSSADSELVITLEANAVYKFVFYLKYDGATGGDIRWNWVGPSGMLGDYALSAVSVAAAAATTEDLAINYSMSATGGAGGLGAGTACGAQATGTITTAAAAGTLTFTWAQFTSSGTATTLQAGSYIECTRIG